MKLTRLKVQKENIAKSEVSESRFIPYKYHWNQNTILAKDNSLVRVIKIKGFSFETADDADVDIKKMGRNNLLKGMSSGNFSLWFSGRAFASFNSSYNLAFFRAFAFFSFPCSST